MITLSKWSSPGWDKQFKTPEEVITELRKHICSLCLLGDESEWHPALDVEYNGVLYECRDLMALLGTPCGCEYGVSNHPDFPELG